VRNRENAARLYLRLWAKQGGMLPVYTSVFGSRKGGMLPVYTSVFGRIRLKPLRRDPSLAPIKLINVSNIHRFEQKRCVPLR